MACGHQQATTPLRTEQLKGWCALAAYCGAHVFLRNSCLNFCIVPLCCVMTGLLAVNLVLQLEQVLLPGVEGYFGVKANHVPIIAQLKPGVVELHEGTEVTKYFVSGGFAFVHPNSVTDICVLEAATLDQFDSTAVKTALTVSMGFGAVSKLCGETSEPGRVGRRMQHCSVIAAAQLRGSCVAWTPQ